jgi:hypothetical protein
VKLTVGASCCAAGGRAQIHTHRELFQKDRDTDSLCEVSPWARVTVRVRVRMRVRGRHRFRGVKWLPTARVRPGSST